MTSTELEKKTEELYNQKFENLRIEFRGSFEKLDLRITNIEHNQGSVVKKLDNIAEQMTSFVTQYAKDNVGNTKDIKSLFKTAGGVNMIVVAVLTTISTTVVVFVLDKFLQ